MGSQNIKKLIIAPHADDDVLGCGGILNSDSFVYYCGIDEFLVEKEIVEGNPENRIPLERRKQEIQDVANFLGFQYEINLDNKVNHYKETDSIKQLEELINRIKPERIFIPFSSYNQDHRAVYNAARIALRPHDKNFFVKKVLVYEQPHSIIWEDKEFNVNYFVQIDIERKIHAYKIHASQVRSMRSPEVLMAIAKIRGTQANCEYAEAFRIERWVE